VISSIDQSIDRSVGTEQAISQAVKSHCCEQEVESCYEPQRYAYSTSWFAIDWTVAQCRYSSIGY
jgi:hypothetical protein